MSFAKLWTKEAGPRIQGSRALDNLKVQAPGIVRLPSGGFRLFYTAVGTEKPYPACQGYILSAISTDGLRFESEPGIRLAPDPAISHMSLRVLAPTVAALPDGRWRMYFEARGPADQPTVIRSACSSDMLHWEHEQGIRLETAGGLGAPRYLPLRGGLARVYCINSEFGPGGPGNGKRLTQSVVSALTRDGLNFEFEPGYRLRDRQAEYDSAGITAAEVIPPTSAGEPWTMLFSAWQEAPAASNIPLHPSHDVNATANGLSEDFAAASIASDMSGYRSRIFAAHSPDGLNWDGAQCVIEGTGYDGAGLDAVHAEDMSLIEISPGRYRMYYAACDNAGNWRIASAVTAT